MEESLSVPVLHHPFSLLAFPLVCWILGAPAGIRGVIVFSGPKWCVSMIQLSVDAKVGVISACSDESSQLQFTMTGLSSSTPHVSFAPIWSLRKKVGVVRPVSPMHVFVESLRRCQRLYVGPAMRRIYAWGYPFFVDTRCRARSHRPCLGLWLYAGSRNVLCSYVGADIALPMSLSSAT